jgi:hypothetical protein
MRLRRPGLEVLLGPFVVSVVASLFGAGCADDEPGVVVDPDDLDGDMIVNADDNCPRARNVDQHDEDGDGVGDDCDNCPSAANAEQSDTTEVALDQMIFADGVGDACDRRPGVGGDDIGAFFPFASDADANAFTGTGWTIADDDLHSSDTAQWMVKRGEQGNGLVVVATITSLAWTASSGGEVSLVIDGDGNTVGDVCTLRHGVGGDELVAREAGGSMTVTSVAAGGDPSAPLVLVAWRLVRTGGNDLMCSIEHGSAKTQAQVALTDDLIAGIYGISATGASAVVSSVIVYTSPAPKTP